MSHFVCAVFTKEGQNYEDLLAPFNEQDEAYMEFTPTDKTQEELLARYEEVKEKYHYSTFDQYMKDYYGYMQQDGAWGYMENPNAKWDWYQDGGRWSGFFRCKDGTPTNGDLVSEIEFGPDPEKYKKALRFWEVVVEEQPQRPDEDGENFFTIWKKEYYLEQYGDKDTYAKHAAASVPFAFITADGEWIEEGSMGWFGCSDSTLDSRAAFTKAYEQYVAEHPDLIVTAVDCHI